MTDGGSENADWSSTSGTLTYQLVTSNHVLGTPFEAKYVVSGGTITPPGLPMRRSDGTANLLRPDIGLRTCPRDGAATP